MSFQWRVYKISCELVAEPSSSTHFSRSPNTAVLLSYLGQGVKTLRRSQTLVLEPLGVYLFWRVRLFQYCSELFGLAATYFEIFGMGAVV